MTGTLVDDAFRWLCKRRIRFPADADIWHLRFHWRFFRPVLIGLWDTGQYHFNPLQRIKLASAETLHLWSYMVRPVLQDKVRS